MCIRDSSLLLESYPDLKFYREVHREYGTDELIVVGFKPNDDLFAAETIEYVTQLTETLLGIDKIDSVTSISTVPLLQQARRIDDEGVSHFKLINDEDVDINLVKQEFTTSALYASNLVSDTGEATAIIANIKMNTTLDKLLQQKYGLLERLEQQADDNILLAQMDELNEQLLVQRNITGQDYESALKQIRQVISQENQAGIFYLAGAPLVSNDIKTYIKNDIVVFFKRGICCKLVIMRDPSVTHTSVFVHFHHSISVSYTHLTLPTKA